MLMHRLLVQIIPYGGKDLSLKGNFGLIRDVVVNLIDCCKTPKCHRVYFDYFFTSHSLMKELKFRGFNATGTVREN